MMNQLKMSSDSLPRTQGGLLSYQVLLLLVLSNPPLKWPILCRVGR